MKLELNSENINFHLNLINHMCEEGKSQEDIKKYIEHMRQKSCMKVLNNEIKLLSYQLKKNIFHGWGNLNADIILVIDKPTEMFYNTGKDEQATNLISSLLSNAAAKLDQKFDSSYIYKTFLFKGKKENDAEIGCYSQLLTTEINIINPKYIICMGQESSNLLIKKDYNLETGRLYNTNPTYVGTYNVFDVAYEENPSPFKANIWKKFELLKSEFEN